VLTNRICASDPCPSSGGDPNNVFRVVIRNVDNAGGIGPWQLRARLRIADCGSAVSKPESVPWTDLASTPPGTEILTGTETSFTNSNGWYWQQEPDSAGSTTSNVIIDYQCNRGANAYCPEPADPTVTHQCVFVEVGGTDTFEFSQLSAYREMINESVGGDAGDASTADSGPSDASRADGSVHTRDGGGGDSSRSGSGGAAGSGLGGFRPSAGGATGSSHDGGVLSSSKDAGQTSSSRDAPPPDEGCGCVIARARSTSNLLAPLAALLSAIVRRRHRARKLRESGQFVSLSNSK
jgi:hypothetical protein